jgi:probable HAF family extracellular repeat protein
MTPRRSFGFQRGGLAMIAAVAALPLLAVAAAASAEVAATPAQSPPDGMHSSFGTRLGPGIAGRPRPLGTASGNLLLDNGVLTPLADVPGAAMTAYFGTNNRGEFAGAYADAVTATPQFHGFLRDQRGRFTRLDPPGAVQTFPFGLNDRGRVAGGYVDAGGAGHGFAWNPGGAFTTFDVPGATITQSFAVNNRDQIVGVYVDASGVRHGFIRTGRSIATIDVPGAIASGAFDLNDRGEIVGGYSDAQGRTHGFRLRDGVFTTIDHPGGRDTLCPGPPGCRADLPGFAASAPLGINNRGQVVGQYADAQGLHAYLLDHGAYTTIDPPGGTTVAADIIDRGEIVLPGPLGLFIQYGGTS